MAALTTIIAAVGAAAALASTAYTISQGSPDIPAPPPPPKPPPPAPPAPAAPPPPPSETEADVPTATRKRRLQSAYGVQQTLITSPLGGSGTGQVGTAGRSLIGG